MKALLSWSSGKDSAWTLHELRQNPDVELVGLLTTVTPEYGRVAMHGVRVELLRAQASAAGLDLIEVELPVPCTNEAYEQAMLGALAAAKDRGVRAVAFGDLFLEDVRQFRVTQMERAGLEPLFPLWGRDTHELAQTITSAPCRVHLTCVDPRQCPREWAGATYDEALLSAMPEGMDPCGENGEFHTFVSAGPMFDRDIEVRVGETVERDGFVFTDLVPA